MTMRWIWLVPSPCDAADRARGRPIQISRAIRRGPRCPATSHWWHALLLEQRLAGLLAGRPGVRISRPVVGSDDEAPRLGMRGSPNLLIDGSDPFPGPGQGPALTCRLCRSDEGRLEGVPAVSALRRAAGAGRPTLLTRGVALPARTSGYPASIGVTWLLSG